VKPEDIGFENVGDYRYPLLRAALRDARPAISFKVEWLVDTPSRDPWVNYTQIVRTPFSVGPGDDYDREKYYALEQHLGEVERVLWDGVPDYTATEATPRSSCGGVRHYLGRDPHAGDRVALRVLRDVALYKNRDDGSSSVRTHEYISEFSLEVVPAPPLVFARVA
jgi:hypothetical protein